jgi:hypothetical protein
VQLRLLQWASIERRHGGVDLDHELDRRLGIDDRHRRHLRAADTDDVRSDEHAHARGQAD